MKQRILIASLIVCLLLGGLAAGVMAAKVQVRAAEPTETPIIAPFCAAYMEWLHKHSAIYQKNSQGHGLGLIPAPVDLAGSTAGGNWGTPMTEQSSGTLQKITGPGQSPGLTTSSGTSSGYDLRTMGRTPAVKDQGQDGNCWAFASVGSLESSLLPGERDSFSENNMKNLHGFDVAPNSGGNDFMAAAYLARWSGPVRASDDPYSDGSTSSPSFLAVQKHVQEVLFVPTRLGPLENDQIKAAITQYGALYSTFHWDDPSYNYRTAGYYYSGSDGPNHAIDIVGWDDNYDRNNFATPAPGNGAFIAENSWGSNWGDGGFFYISYYDNRIGRDNAMFTAQAPNNYARMYQYDPLGWVANFGMGSDTAYYANVFTAQGNEQIKAVSFYTTATSAEYEIKVFLDPDHGPVSSAGYVASQTGIMDLPGYHTVSLSTPVTLKAGERFSVAVKAHSPGWNFPVAIEYPISGYSSSATASAGQSYISSDGSSWSDLTASQPNTNVCLKAFTTAASAGTVKTPVSTFPAPVFTTGSTTSISTSAILKKLNSNGLFTIKSSIPLTVLKSAGESPGPVSLPVLPGSGISEIGIMTLDNQHNDEIPAIPSGTLIRNLSWKTPLI